MKHFVISLRLLMKRDYHEYVGEIIEINVKLCTKIIRYLYGKHIFS